MTPYGNSPVEKKRGCEPPRVAMPRGSPPAQKIGRPVPIATSAVAPSPARSIAHTTRSIASSNTKHRAVTRPMLRSSSHVDQTSLGPVLVDSIRISAPQCKKPRGLSHSGLRSTFCWLPKTLTAHMSQLHVRGQPHQYRSNNESAGNRSTSGRGSTPSRRGTTTYQRHAASRCKCRSDEHDRASACQSHDVVTGVLGTASCRASCRLPVTPRSTWRHSPLSETVRGCVQVNAT